jgi:hypothetical protein
MESRTTHTYSVFFDGSGNGKGKGKGKGETAPDVPDEHEEEEENPGKGKGKGEGVPDQTAPDEAAPIRVRYLALRRYPLPQEHGMRTRWLNGLFVGTDDHDTIDQGIFFEAPSWHIESEDDDISYDRRLEFVQNLPEDVRAWQVTSPNGELYYLHEPMHNPRTLRFTRNAERQVFMHGMPDGSDHDGSDHDGGNPIMLVVREDGNHDVIGLHDPSIVPGNPIRVLIVLRADGAHVFLPGGPENYEDDNLMAAMVFEQATPLLPQDGSLIGMDIYPRFIRNHTDPPVSFENLHLVEPTVQDRRQ